LNCLFNSGFSINYSKIGRKGPFGINICYNKRKSLFIIDLNINKDANDPNYYKIKEIYSIFTFAISDIFILNFWLHEVGRFKAINFDLISHIFRMNLWVLKSDKKYLN